jgi:hypothetical protein
VNRAQQRIIKNTRKAGLNALQTRMALILLSVNGPENAQEFIDGTKRRVDKERNGVQLFLFEEPVT